MSACRDEDRVWEAIVRWASSLGAALRLVARHPWLTLVIVMATFVGALWGAPAALVLVTVLLVGLVVWRWRGPSSFERVVLERPARARRRNRYRRDWAEVVTASGLVATGDGGIELPKLVAVESGDYVDRLTVDLLAGQTPEDWAREADAIAHGLGVPLARVRVVRPARIVVELAHGDALVEVVPALPIVVDVDLRAVPVGVTETGAPWVLPVLGSHHLVVGMTGSGKSSIIWSLLRGVAPAVAAGTVRVACLDPKGGMELAPGAVMFDRFEATFDGIADCLDQTVEVMQERAGRLRGVARALEPTVDEPLLLVVVDELATLTAYQPDRKLRDRIANALALLCTQGRAVGVCVVGAVQDPRKEVVSIRDLFPTKIALRLGNRTQVDMVLGDGAREAGARCDVIPSSTPGVGFVLVDGEVEPVRVRAAFVSDEDIAEMVERFPAPTRVLDEDQDVDEESVA